MISRSFGADISLGFMLGHRGVRRSIRGSATVLAALPPGKYRALTKIRLRKEPDVASEPTGESIIAGEEFEATQAVDASPGSPGYLKVGGGWIFDQGIAGRWLGKPIIELIEAAAPSPASQPPPVSKATPPPAASQPPPPKATQPPPTAASQPPPASKATPPPSQPLPTSKATSTPPTVTEDSPEPAKSSRTKDSAKPQAEPQTETESTETEVLGTPAVALGVTKVETARLPDEILGAGFEFVRLAADQTQQPLTFMLGNGFPCNALTIRGRALLDVESSDFKGGWLSQAEKQQNVDLRNLRFFETGAKIADIPDFSVMDFPQAMLAEQLGIEVHGILGKPFFKQYDLDLDRYGARAELYLPGEAASQGFYSGVKHLPGIELPGGNLGLAMKGKIVGEANEEVEESDFAFIGLVDSSAAHTVLNWEAAKLLGFSGPSDPRLATAAKVLAASADGSAEEMPVTLARLSLCSAPDGVKPMLLSVTKEEWESTGGKGWYFEDLSGGDVCIEFGAVNVAIGNPLSLSVLADSKIGPFTGAAAIIGQDLLFQADRLVLNMKDSQVWLQPGEMKDAAEM